MKTIKNRLHVNRMAVFLLSGIALIDCCWRLPRGLTCLVKNWSKTGHMQWQTVFLQARYMDYHGKAIGRSVQSLLTEAQRERDARIQEICANYSPPIRQSTISAKKSALWPPAGYIGQ